MDNSEHSDLVLGVTLFRKDVNNLDDLPTYYSIEYQPTTIHTPDGNYGVAYSLLNSPGLTYGDGAQLAANVTGSLHLWIRRRTNGTWSQWHAFVTVE